MPLNPDLKRILDNNLIPPSPEGLAALDAILRAGQGDDEGARRRFRQAIYEHRAIWNPLLRDVRAIAEDEDTGLNDYLVAAGYDDHGEMVGTFAELVSSAAKNRVLATLQEATEAQLIAFISAPADVAARRQLFGNDGNSLFGDPQVRVANWNAEEANILDHDAIVALQIAAKCQLLHSKIARFSNADAQAKLDRLALTDDNNEFRELVRELFGSRPDAAHPTADLMERGQVQAGIRREAAKKAVLLGIKGLSDQEILDNYGFNVLNENDPGDFRDELVGVSQATAHLHEQDINEIKGVLGTRFLTLKVAELGADQIARMENIATSDDSADISRILKEINELTNGEDGAYIDEVVKESLPVIRNACAVQALKMKISNCEDVATLDALVAITSVAGLKDLLANDDALGYKDRPAFREGLLSTTNISPLIAAAHIRKNIAFSDKTGYLRELIAIDDDPVTFRTKYHERFSAGAGPALKAAINAHFADDGVNIKQAREQALISYAQTELSEVVDEVLDGLIDAVGEADVQTEVDTLLGIDDIADDLLGEPNVGVSKTIRIYAAIEKAIRNADEFAEDISRATGGATYDELLEKINDFRFAGTLNDLLNDEDCPPQQKGRVQAAWVEALVRNYPDDRPAFNDLVELANKATDLDKFKDLLTDKFGINDVSWVTKSTMEQVQKAACIRAIELADTHHLAYGSYAHRALFSLIADLPLPKLQALLDKPAALTALALAPSPDEVERVLWGKNLVDEELIEDLVAENKRFLSIAKIANSEIASILADMDPPVELDDAIVAQINNELLTKPITNKAEYISFINDIVENYFPDSEAELNEAFGLNVTADDIDDQNIADAIIAQHRYNEHLIARYHNNAKTFPDSQAIILGLLSLSKKAQLPADRILNANAGIVTDIKNSKTLAEFLNLTRDYRDVFDPPLEKQLTPQSFEQLKIKARSKVLSSPKHYEKALATQKQETDLIDQQFSDIVLVGLDRRKLKRLTEINPIYWFNPAFQAAAKQNAATMGPELRELATQCDSYVTYLTNQKRVIDAQIQSLPSKSEIAATVSATVPLNERAKTVKAMAKGVDERRAELTGLSQRMTKELADYKTLQEVFNGDPDAASTKHPLIRQGLLKTLDMAAAGRADVRLSGFGGHYVDCPNASRADHLVDTWTGEAKPAGARSEFSEMSHEDFEEGFDIVPEIPPGKFREHTVIFKKPTGGEEKGLFIEERASHNVAGQIKPDGTISYEPALKLTASKFPPTHEARMHYAMAMASHMLAKMKTAPTADSPIKLRGTDPTEIRYLWTALMILGETDKNLKFKQDAIKVFSAQFDPKSEFSMGGLRWGAQALYHKFKSSPQIGGWMRGIKEVNEKKFSTDEQEGREQAMQDTSELTDFFRGKMTEIMKENETHEETHGATLGSTGPTI